MTDYIDRELADGVLRLTINRPEKLNAFTHATYATIRDELTAATWDPKINVVVLRGRGRAFSAGFDLGIHADEDLDDGLRRRQEMQTISQAARWAVWNCEKPVVTGIQGYCIGGPGELALLSDFVIAEVGTKISIPEIQFNAGPAFHFLPWMTSHLMAKDILLTGRKLDAEEALRGGLITRIAAEGALDALVEEYVDVLRRLPMGAVRKNKIGINRAYEAQGMAAYVNNWLDVGSTAGFTGPASAGDFWNQIREQGVAAAVEWRESTFGVRDSG
jgi:enoyl-CoA hydratase